jgi:hypothetical protein
MSFFGTPMNMRPTTPFMKRGRIDYIKEMNALHVGEYPMWDNTQDNEITVGDYFAFVFKREDRMQIFKVIGTQPSRERLEEWDIQRHSERSVIVLSKDFSEMSFSVYKEIVSYKPGYYLRDTVRMKNL